MNHRQEKAAFYLMYGRAMGAWAAVEMGLGHVVCGVFDANPPDNLLKAYYAIENFRSKLAFADELMRSHFPTTPLGKVASQVILRRWRRLRPTIERNARTRNRLAHGAHITGDLSRTGRRYLIASYVDHENGARNRPLGLLDVATAEAAFLTLYSELLELSHILYRVVPPDYSGAHVYRPPTLAMLKESVIWHADKETNKDLNEAIHREKKPARRAARFRPQ